jgi:SNF2 family DNA or RNA helicase
VVDFGKAIDLIERLQTHESNVEVLWDKTSEPPIHVLGTVSSQNVRVGIAQKRDWFNLTGTCMVGDKEFDIVTLMDSLRSDAEGTRYGDYVKIKDGGWAKISDQLRKSLMQIRDSVNQERGALRFDRTSAIAMREAEQHLQIQSTRAWQECLAKLSRSEKLEPVLPDSLKATLRDYQIDGYKWLRRLAEWGVGGILADDMGLGKTVQTLAAVIDRAEEGPALVIAPTSVCFNWMREVEKFAPGMTAFMYRETDRAEFLTSVGNNNIIVCSYGLALRDAEQLAKVDWGTMVLDEAQAIKNSRSKTSMAIATIPSKWTVALTGTPVENHLGELWSLFRIVAPGVFGGWDQFRTRFAGPIERDDDDERRGALRKRLQPFVLRRTKKEVLKDLPARTEMNLYVELSAAERALYDEIRLSAIGEADAITKLPDIQDQRFKILALLTRLRQISCHPRLVHDSWKEGSAKLAQLTETLLQLREEGHRVLIFSQFVTHLQLIREMLEKESITYQYLDGSTPAAERQGQVDQFQNGDATAFLISLKAGGTGLNLTAADYVIHMDPWWNPAVEDQATDRAHRIGQQKPVMVYRIVAQNTIEEEILRLHDTKRDLVAGVLDGTHSAGKLSTADLLALLRA